MHCFDLCDCPWQGPVFRSESKTFASVCDSLLVHIDRSHLLFDCLGTMLEQLSASKRGQSMQPLHGKSAPFMICFRTNLASLQMPRLRSKQLSLDQDISAALPAAEGLPDGSASRVPCAGPTFGAPYSDPNRKQHHKSHRLPLPLLRGLPLMALGLHLLSLTYATWITWCLSDMDHSLLICFKESKTWKTTWLCCSRQRSPSSPSQSQECER